PPRRPPSSPLFPYTTLFRSPSADSEDAMPSTQSTDQTMQRYLVLLRPEDPDRGVRVLAELAQATVVIRSRDTGTPRQPPCVLVLDRKSTRLNSSHVKISYAV